MKSALNENDKRHWEALNEPYWEMDKQRKDRERYHWALHRAYYTQLRLAEAFDDLFQNRLRYYGMEDNADLMACRNGTYPLDPPFWEKVVMVFRSMGPILKKVW